MKEGDLRARKYCVGCKAESSLYGRDHYHARLISANNVAFWVETCKPSCIPRALAKGDKLFDEIYYRHTLIEDSYKARYGEDVVIPEADAWVWEESGEPPLTS